MLRHLIIPLFAVMLPSICIGANTLTRIDGLTIVENPYNDGDSFHVTDGSREYYLRLYFVDAPETSANSAAMAKRVREQTRYFGFDDYAVTVSVGRKATAYTQEQLKQAFTAYTAFADARSSSTKKRIYAFIVTANGKGLGELLIRNGLARAYGVGRINHEGIPMDELKARFADLEASAMLARKGIWKYADAERIAELRALERSQNMELQDISQIVKNQGRPPDSKININTVSEKELQILPGIGPATAQRIVEGRPYLTANDLTRVKGIGPKTLEKLTPLIDL